MAKQELKFNKDCEKQVCECGSDKFYVYSNPKTDGQNAICCKCNQMSFFIPNTIKGRKVAKLVVPEAFKRVN